MGSVIHSRSFFTDVSVQDYQQQAKTYTFISCTVVFSSVLHRTKIKSLLWTLFTINLQIQDVSSDLKILNNIPHNQYLTWCYITFLQEFLTDGMRGEQFAVFLYSLRLMALPQSICCRVGFADAPYSSEIREGLCHLEQLLLQWFHLISKKIKKLWSLTKFHAPQFAIIFVPSE
jgi:hypothetical protein